VKNPGPPKRLGTWLTMFYNSFEGTQPILLVKGVNTIVEWKAHELEKF